MSMPFSVKSFLSSNNELTNEEKVICYQLTITLALNPRVFFPNFALKLWKKKIGFEATWRY